MSLIRSSNKRPTPLKDADFDHEIVLFDHTRLVRPASVRDADAAGRLSETLTRSTTRKESDGGPLHQSGSTIRQDWSRRKWTKNRMREQQEDSHEDETAASTSYDDGASDSGDDAEELNSPLGDDDQRRLRGRSISPRRHDDKDSAIDVLYENQRGGFLCGMALFSSRALGNLDPAPWTNAAHKPSATNPANAQVPDPYWQWAWRDWTINQDGKVDDQGWQYSFAFSKKFSWHKGSWWNSYVRRRVWIRKRVKRQPSFPDAKEASVLNNDNYFAIHSAQDSAITYTQSCAASTEPDKNRYSIQELIRKDASDEISTGDIPNIEALMNLLRFLRIDREKMEAVESFIEHGKHKLAQLENHMHDIMHLFVFQASRRLLLAHLIKILDERTSNVSQSSSKDPDRQSESLQKAVKAAEKEVQRLEFWSDVRDMAANGETRGAVDSSRGWDEDKWVGIDGSGPQDLKRLSGEKDVRSSVAQSRSSSRKGKGKGKDDQT